MDAKLLERATELKKEISTHKDLIKRADTLLKSKSRSWGAWYELHETISKIEKIQTAVLKLLVEHCQYQLDKAQAELDLL